MNDTLTDSFERRVAATIASHRLISPGGRVGVALSGGADSVALLAVLRALGYECVALNCNFHLRGEESDRDSRYARDVAQLLGAGFAGIDFDTEARRRRTGESIEMACRELRYEWFGRIAAELSLEAVAVGHHREDRVETFFINALRRTGVRGLSAMRHRRGIFVRPLLDTSRVEIENYLARRGLRYVTDSSNASDDYTRNRIRNRLLPAVRQTAEEADERLADTIDNLEHTSLLLDHLVGERISRYTDSDGAIDLRRMRETEGDMAEELLFEALRLGGEPEKMSTVRNMLRAAFESGADFGLRRVERGRLTTATRREDPDREKGVAVTPADWPFESETIGRDEFRPVRDPWRAWFDASVLDGDPEFELRPWRTGDRMRPFGIKGSRLVSDIFNDAKLTEREKRAVRLLTRNGEILWIPGLKCSSLFPVTPRTERIVGLLSKKNRKEQTEIDD